MSLFFNYLFYRHIHVCVPECVYVLHMYAGAYRCQKRAFDHLELELHAVIRHSVGAENQPKFVRAVSVLNG